MIVQIRGTSGSGKTTAMKEIMEQVGTWKPIMVEGRRRPLYYRDKKLNAVVLGHYEIDCGGCDTIGSAPRVYNVLCDLKYNVALSEGLLWGEDVKWTLELRDAGQEIRSFFLITDPEECLRRVVKRQAGRKPADPVRVRRKLMTRVGTIDRARLRLIDAGVNCKRVNVNQAVKQVIKLLKENDNG